MSTERFAFAFDRRFAPLLAIGGVRPASSSVRVTDETFEARFGPWSLRTPLTNIRAVTVTGPYRWWRAIGPRGSFADRGATFGTTARGGTCVSFHEPVPALFGDRMLHPSLTVTVEDPAALATTLRSRCPDLGDAPSSGSSSG